MNFPRIPAAKMVSRLEPPKGRIRMVLDTDTYNEIDDQFAVVHALLSADRLSVEGIYAAPFFNSRSSGPQEGMEKSYEEILRLLERLQIPNEGFVYKGSKDYLRDIHSPHRSEAALDLVQRAMSADEDNPLYVVAIGAITNIASAILIEPRIIEKMVLVWLGGHAFHWPNTKEFNLRQDIVASRLIFDCGVPLVHIPCAGVTTHLATTLPEMEKYVKGRGEIGDFLYERFKEYHKDHYAYSKVLWDIATIAYLLDENYVQTEIVHSPILTDQLTWSFDSSRHFIRYASYLNRDMIYKDLFEKLERYALSVNADES